MGDHDALFKRVFGVPAHAAAELSAVLPVALAERLDLSTLAVEPGSFVDEELADQHTDPLFRCALRSGHPAFIYFLLEHQSEPDRWMPWRVLGATLNECLRISTLGVAIWIAWRAILSGVTTWLSSCATL